MGKPGYVEGRGCLFLEPLSGHIALLILLFHFNTTVLSGFESILPREINSAAGIEEGVFLAWEEASVSILQGYSHWPCSLTGLTLRLHDP